MIENRPSRPTPEYPIGSLVPILQHNCLPGKLGLKGRVTELSTSNVPLSAKCTDCRKEIAVDIQALKNG